MLPRVGSLHRRFHVSPAGGADGHDVNAAVGEHCFQTVINSHPGIGSGKPISRLGAGIVTGDDFRPLDVLDRFGMEIRDHAAADDPKPGGCHELYPGGVMDSGLESEDSNQ